MRSAVGMTHSLRSDLWWTRYSSWFQVNFFLVFVCTPVHRVHWISLILSTQSKSNIVFASLLFLLCLEFQKGQFHIQHQCHYHHPPCSISATSPFPHRPCTCLSHHPTSGSTRSLPRQFPTIFLALCHIPLCHLSISLQHCLFPEDFNQLLAQTLHLRLLSVAVKQFFCLISRVCNALRALCGSNLSISHTASSINTVTDFWPDFFTHWFHVLQMGSWVHWPLIMNSIPYKSYKAIVYFERVYEVQGCTDLSYHPFALISLQTPICIFQGVHEVQGCTDLSDHPHSLFQISFRSKKLSF